MAPRKSMKKAGAKRSLAQTRCDSVKKSLSLAHGCEFRVKQMLCNTLSFTVGTHKADRHPFNERFVAMIEQVLEAEHARLNQDVRSKEAAFNELGPAKGTREVAVEQAKAAASLKGEDLDKAKHAVSEIGATVKQAGAALKEAVKAQKSGDEEIGGLIVKESLLEDTQSNSLVPLVAGAAPEEDKSGKIKAVLGAGVSFGFDKSLLNTAEQVLHRDVAERGLFDNTCLDQLKEAFASAIANFGAEIQAGAPAKAERAAVVEQAQAAKETAEASQMDLKAKLAAAKDAKAAADIAQTAAVKSLADFMPDLKAAGDGLDEAKNTVKSFEDGPRTAFHELKEYKQGDFVPVVKKSYYEKVDGLNCDREVIDACRAAVEGGGDGRVSIDDATKVFAALADGGKQTRVERWTLRYCMQVFKWSEASHDWIVAELKKVPQENAARPAKKARGGGSSYYEMVDGYKCDRGIVDACREAVAGEGDGRVSVEDAQKVWAKASDGNNVTDAEKWTVRYCLSAFNWTRAGHDYLLEQLQKDAVAA